MADLERRVTRLETQMNRDDAGLAWADVHDALMREQARARLAVCRRLDVDAQDPRIVEAMTSLVDDDPARLAQDRALIARWRQVQGIPEDTGDVRQRILQRFDIMTRRLQA